MFPVKVAAVEVQTTPYPDVVFRSVGIRKSLSTFLNPNYVENLVQSILGILRAPSGSFVIGGDGRAFTNSAIQSVIQVLAGNGMRRAVVAQHGLLTSSMATLLVKRHECHAGFLFTGGHQKAGEDGCFGLKVISPPGVPFPPPRSVKVTRLAETMASYRSSPELTVDVAELGTREFLVSNKKFTVEVVDPIPPYIEALRHMFDFRSLRKFLAGEFKILIDCSNGVSCLCAERIFTQHLKVGPECIVGHTPSSTFGQRGPDVDPLICREFVETAKVDKCHFAAVISGDASRCMILGEDGFHVSPSDSLAILAAHSECIPFFEEKPAKMFVRSVCTSKAVDSVGKHASIVCLEVLPGWTNFTPAMLAQPHASILYGEESFGIGVSSFCDRDGIWSVLAWLSVLSHTKMSVRTVVEDLWRTFGRTFFTRYDYEKVLESQCDELVSYLENTQFLRFKKKKVGSFEHVEYLDPFGIDPRLDTEEEKKKDVEVVYEIENYIKPYGFVGDMKDEINKVFQIRLSDCSRVIVRRSESTYGLPTIRMYVEYTVENAEDDKLYRGVQEVLAPFVEASLKMTKIREFTGRNRPNTIK